MKKFLDQEANHKYFPELLKISPNLEDFQTKKFQILELVGELFK